MPRWTEPRVVAVLREHGPMTSRAYARELDLHDAYARAQVSYAHTRQLIYIKEWIRSNEHCKTIRLCAVYAAGPGLDAPKPSKLPQTVTSKRHRDKKRRMAASIFLAALPVAQRRLTSVKRPDIAERWSAIKALASNCDLP